MPLIPDLPEEHFSDDPPFTHTGIDFAGPHSAGEDEVVKCYVCVFTCASLEHCTYRHVSCYLFVVSVDIGVYPQH